VKFVEYQDISKNRIRELQENQVRIHQHWYFLPCAISAQKIITHQSPKENLFKVEVSTDCFEQLLQEEAADLILIGRANDRLIFDIKWQQLVADMSQQGIGLEQMSHAAAVRTFNVLMTEERPFWLILV
jgi:uncharacterized protein